jgi:hypothetical protein
VDAIFILFLQGTYLSSLPSDPEIDFSRSLISHVGLCLYLSIALAFAFIPDAAGGEGGHGVAKPDRVIHR